MDFSSLKKGGEKENKRKEAHISVTTSSERHARRWNCPGETPENASVSCLLLGFVGGLSFGGIFSTTGGIFFVS